MRNNFPVDFFRGMCYTEKDKFRPAQRVGGIGGKHMQILQIIGVCALIAVGIAIIVFTLLRRRPDSRREDHDAAGQPGSDDTDRQ